MKFHFINFNDNISMLFKGLYIYIYIYSFFIETIKQKYSLHLVWLLSNQVCIQEHLGIDFKNKIHLTFQDFMEPYPKAETPPFRIVPQKQVTYTSLPNPFSYTFNNNHSNPKSTYFVTITVEVCAIDSWHSQNTVNSQRILHSQPFGSTPASTSTQFSTIPSHPPIKAQLVSFL